MSQLVESYIYIYFFLTLAQKHIFVTFLGYGNRFLDTFVIMK